MAVTYLAMGGRFPGFIAGVEIRRNRRCGGGGGAGGPLKAIIERLQDVGRTEEWPQAAGWKRQ